MNPDLIKLTDTTRYVRDTFSKAVVSVDSSGLAAYKAQRRSAEQIRSLETDINSVKIELETLRKLLLTSLEHKQP